MWVDITVIGQTASNNSSGTHYLQYRWSTNGSPYSIDTLALNFNPNDPDTKNFANAGSYHLGFVHNVVGGVTFTGDLAFRRQTDASGTGKVYAARVNGLYIPGINTSSW